LHYAKPALAGSRPTPGAEMHRVSRRKSIICAARKRHTTQMAFHRHSVRTLFWSTAVFMRCGINAVTKERVVNFGYGRWRSLVQPRKIVERPSVRLVALRKILVHNGSPLLYPRILLPRRIGVFEIGARDDSLLILEACRPQRACHRTGRIPTAMAPRANWKGFLRLSLSRVR
jgi:hypothetical protein